MVLGCEIRAEGLFRRAMVVGAAILGKPFGGPLQHYL